MIKNIIFLIACFCIPTYSFCQINHSMYQGYDGGGDYLYMEQIKLHHYPFFPLPALRYNLPFDWIGLRFESAYQLDLWGHPSYPPSLCISNYKYKDSFCVAWRHTYIDLSNLFAGTQQSWVEYKDNKLDKVYSTYVFPKHYSYPEPPGDTISIDTIIHEFEYVNEQLIIEKAYFKSYCQKKYTTRHFRLTKFFYDKNGLPEKLEVFGYENGLLNEKKSYEIIPKAPSPFKIYAKNFTVNKDSLPVMIRRLEPFIQSPNPPVDVIMYFKYKNP